MGGTGGTLDDEPIVLRPTKQAMGRRSYSLWPVVIAVLCFLVGAPFMVAFGIVLSALAAFLLIRMTRCRVVLRVDRVEIHDVWRDRWVDRSLVERVELRPRRGLWIYAADSGRYWAVDDVVGVVLVTAERDIDCEALRCSRREPEYRAFERKVAIVRDWSDDLRTPSPPAAS